MQRAQTGRPDGLWGSGSERLRIWQARRPREPGNFPGILDAGTLRRAGMRRADGRPDGARSAEETMN